MVMHKERELNLKAMTGIASLANQKAPLFGRIDIVNIVRVAGKESIVIKAHLYADDEHGVRNIIPGVEQTIRYAAIETPETVAFVDPENGVTYNDGRPAIPPVKALMDSPLRSIPAKLETVGDVLNCLYRELYLRIPEIDPEWQGSVEA